MFEKDNHFFQNKIDQNPQKPMKIQIFFPKKQREKENTFNIAYLYLFIQQYNNEKKKDFPSPKNIMRFLSDDHLSCDEAYKKEK